ncbi:MULTISPECIES: hypothetical protein [Chryseobacterium]|uniref:DUF4340 domain-containing protein n=1 Tax=Candidatus Chryseobacterium massiliense TaxID=204089 RepID=A0A3D9ALN7_9FLAO|nr:MULTISPECIES: hypothetical protein [Chryseobacterium]REC41987.1 hypothetical protein DRF68_18225 [Candidatus Chryseobacterium massiliae]
MKKKLFALAFLLLAGTVYFVFYYQKDTKIFSPKEADAIILIDTKKLTREYVYSLIEHPSLWFESKGKNKISFRKSGVKIPDFLQIFHLKSSKVSNWYSVFELEDRKTFLLFLKQQKFTDLGNQVFRKDQVFIKTFGEKLIIGSSSDDFERINNQLFHSSQANLFDADTLVTNGLGSIILNTKKGSHNLSVELRHDEIEIRNQSDSYDPSPVISKLLETDSFLETKLDAENIKNFSSIFDKTFADSSSVNEIKASVHLEEVNDTIITYSYDDNFNEVEKKTFQKITQPNYIIDFQSLNPEKTKLYFHNKKWINAQNQFTAIPFQPNLITQNSKGFEIKSTRKPVQQSFNLNENYIFVKNNPLLLSFLKTLSPKEKKIISDIDYIFYGNRDQDYCLKIQFKKDDLPLILRW